MISSSLGTRNKGGFSSTCGMFHSMRSLSSPISRGTYVTLLMAYYLQPQASCHVQPVYRLSAQFLPHTGSRHSHQLIRMHFPPQSPSNPLIYPTTFPIPIPQLLQPLLLRPRLNQPNKEPLLQINKPPLFHPFPYLPMNHQPILFTYPTFELSRNRHTLS
jgi:hypothetical protein